MYYLIRQHLVPTRVQVSDVLNLYQFKMNTCSITLTSRSVDKIFRKRYRREECWHCVKVYLQYDDEEDFLKAVLAESMEDDIMKRGDGFEFETLKTGKIGACPICFDCVALVHLPRCSCGFCEKCIHESVRYTNRCPLCYLRIYERKSCNDNVAKEAQAQRVV